MAGALTLRGTMRAHTDMVTAIATPIDNSDMIVTSSRDKSIILWKLTKEENVYGVPYCRLNGHSHFVQDVVLSSGSQFALSGSWDGDLRLWDLNAGVSTRRYMIRRTTLSYESFCGEVRACQLLMQACLFTDNLQ